MPTLTKVYTQDWSEDSVWIFNTPSKFALESLFYVQEAGLFHCRPNYYTEHENISSFIIALVLDGTGTYRFRGREYNLVRGDLFFADCMEYHSYRTGESGAWDKLWVQFNGVTAHGYHARFLEQGPPVIRAGHGGQVAESLLELIEVNRSRSLHAELVSSKLLTDILTEILLLAGAAPTADTHMPLYISKAVQDISAHIHEELSLDYFARTLMISKYHFLKEFKKYTGYTPNEYIRLSRVNLAKHLLKFTDMNIYEIAEKTGFQSTSYFANTFKKITGMTPLQFRSTGQL